jgi:hypothetical protein
MRRLYKALLALSIVPGVLVLDDDLGFVNKAQAIIGRPLTPFSVAGVARRTTRRAYRRAYYYGGGAALAAGAAAGAYYGGYSYPGYSSGYGYGAYSDPGYYSGYGYGSPYYPYYSNIVRSPYYPYRFGGYGYRYRRY